jgi:hypothetical protein
LGGFMPAGSAYALPSRTVFAALGGRYRLRDTTALTGEVGFGSTELEGRFLSLTDAAVSSTWRFGLTETCRGWGLGCRSLQLELSQPLRVERGTFAAILPDVPEEYFDPITFSRRTFSATPSGRQIDLTLRSVHGLPDGSLLALEAVAIRHENHRREAEPGFAVLAAWTRDF